MRAEIPENFRFYAALCREFAEASPYPEWAQPLLAQAERWEHVAEFVERDAAALSTCRKLLARIDEEMKRRPARTTEPGQR